MLRVELVREKEHVLGKRWRGGEDDGDWGGGFVGERWEKKASFPPPYTLSPCLLSPGTPLH